MFNGYDARNSHRIHADGGKPLVSPGAAEPNNATSARQVSDRSLVQVRWTCNNLSTPRWRLPSHLCHHLDHRPRRDERHAMTITVAMKRLLGAALAFVSAVSAAQAASVREVFEKYDLLGTFAVDCSKPPSEENWYFVHDAIGDDRVQRNMLTGPATRKFQFIYDQGSDLRANEINLRGTRDGAPLETVWRVARGQQTEIDTTLRGAKVISAGKFLSNGHDVPRTSKCAPRDATSAQVRSGSSLQLVVNGVTRSFLLHAPATSGPHPTIIMLHGYTGMPKTSQRQAGLPASRRVRGSWRRSRAASLTNGITICPARSFRSSSRRSSHSAAFPTMSPSSGRWWPTL